MDYKEVFSFFTRNIQWNINTKTSLSGLFGTGCFISWALAAGEISKQDRNPRKIGTGIVTGAIFGIACIYLTKTQNKHEVDLAIIKHPTASIGLSNSQGSSTQTTPQIIRPKEFVFGKQDTPPKNYDKRQLVGKLIGIEDICIIYSEPNLGKSVLAFQIAHDIALGIQSAVQPDDQGEHLSQVSLYCDTEMSEDDYERRYPNFIQPEKLRILRGFYFNNENEWLDDIEKRIFEIGADITVYLDNITGAFQLMNAEQMRYFMVVRLRQIQEKAKSKGFHVTFIVLAHTTKEGILAGTSNFQNFATTIIHLKPGPDEYHNEMEVNKCRNYGEMRGKCFLLRRSEVGFKHFELEAEFDAKPAQPAAPVQPVKPASKEPMYPPLTVSQVEDMRKRVNSGEQKKVVAASYGIPAPYVDRYLEGKKKPVPDGDNTGDNTPETDE